ncbi:MAG: acyltransferase family protein [Pseudomonadota bacterium]
MMAGHGHPASRTHDPGLEIARGIAILLVVVGHVVSSPVEELIFLFHMPFFFLMGGHLFRPHAARAEIRRRSARLLVPYLAYLAVLSIPILLPRLLESDLAQAASRLLHLIAGGEGLVSPLSVFWFPTCYFLTAIVYNVLVERFRRQTIWALSFGLLGLATLNQLSWPQFWLPWAFNVCAMAIPMFHLGCEFGPRLFRPSYQLLLASCTFAVGYMLCIVWQDAPTMDMKRAEYGFPIVTLLAALACCVVLVRTSRALVAAPFLAAFLAYCGSASMTLMYVHVPVQMVLFSSGIVGVWERILVSTGLSLIVHWLFTRLSLTRRVFLGQPASRTL